MRRTIKGAAALAALCAGALAFSPIASAASSVGRVAGLDRIGTSLVAFKMATDSSSPNVFIVGFDGTVDALSLAPLAKKLGGGYVIYTKASGLDQATIDALKANMPGKVFVIGGEKVVSSNVITQLTEKVKIDAANIARLGGVDRYETAFRVGAVVADSGSDVLTAAAELATVEGTRDALQKAWDAYQEALKDSMAAKVKADKAVQELADATAKWEAGAAELAGPSKAKLETLNDAIAAAKEARAAVNDLEARKNAAVKARNVLVQAAGEDGDTKTLKALAEADDASDAVKEAVKTLTEGDKALYAVGTSGDAISADTTLGDLQTRIIKFSEEISTELATADKDLRDALIKYQKESSKVNKGNDAELTKLAEAYNKAAKAQTDADEAAKKAAKKLADAQDKLTEATKGDNAAIAIAAKTLAYNKAATKAYAGAKNLFFTTGTDFADALTAGPAAASLTSVAPILLTQGDKVPAYTKMALDASAAYKVAIGGPAAKAVPSAAAYFGADRYATAVAVADKYFSKVEGGTYALASGETGADAVVAGVYLTNHTAKGILLTKKNMLPAATANFISFGGSGAAIHPVSSVVIFGGHAVISPAVENAVKTAMAQ